MNCDDIFEVVLSGEHLSDEMVEHMANCEECLSLQEAVRVLSEAGEHDRKRDLSTSTVDAILAGARSIQALKNRPPHTQMTEWRFLRGLASAAAVLVVMGAGVMLIQHFLSEDEPRPVSVAGVADLPSGDIEDQMAEARQNVDCFRARYRERKMLAGMDADMIELRARLSLATVGIEHELVGL